jgi:hypothetical protein
VALVPKQRAIVDGFLATVTSSTRLDSQLGGTLFEILVPNRIKELAPERRDLLVQLDAESARYPWEMLFDPLAEDSEPLGVTAGLLRQLETGEIGLRERPVMAGEQTALVVGDPDAKLPVSRLPGAQVEAREVERMLRASRYAVEAPLIRCRHRPPGAFARPYRILTSRPTEFEHATHSTHRVPCLPKPSRMPEWSAAWSWECCPPGGLIEQARAEFFINWSLGHTG